MAMFKILLTARDSSQGASRPFNSTVDLYEQQIILGTPCSLTTHVLGTPRSLTINRHAKLSIDQ